MHFSVQILFSLRTMFNVHPYCFVYTWLILFFVTEYKSTVKVHCSLLVDYPVIDSKVGKCSIYNR